jgi:hypothetical protein
VGTAAKAVELIAQQYRDAIAALQAIMPLLKYHSRKTRRIAASAKFRTRLDRADHRHGHIRFADEGPESVQRV